MAPEGERRSGAQSGKDDFDGRDLLVGRPEKSEGRSVTESPMPAPTPPLPTSPQAAPPCQPGARDDRDDHGDAIREILDAVRSTAARVDALRDAQEPERETAGALARETAALTQAVADARDALAKAAELAARRDGAAETARALAGAAAALKTQGEALDQRIRAADRQSAVAAHSFEDMNQSAMALNDQLRTLGNDLLRISDRLKWRHWRFGLAVAGAAFVFFVLGAVLQRETDVVSFGDPRREWNEFVAEHYAPTIAACASEARTDNVIIGCRLRIHPSLDVTIPLYPDVILTDVPPDEQGDPEAER